MKNNRTLPRIVHGICRQGAWIVGSYADPDAVDPKDIDIVVPFELWYNVAVLRDGVITIIKN